MTEELKRGQDIWVSMDNVNFALRIFDGFNEDGTVCVKNGRRVGWKFYRLIEPKPTPTTENLPVHTISVSRHIPNGVKYTVI